MKSKWARAHWTIGTLTLMLFPFAGLYMRYVADVPHLSDAPRLMFRSRFLFLLLIAIVNLGLSYSEPQRLMQRVAAAIILVAPLPLIVSFFVDPSRGVSSSPWTFLRCAAFFWPPFCLLGPTVLAAFTAVRLVLCSVRRDFSPLHPKTMALCSDGQ
jgi:hypothetical protein